MGNSSSIVNPFTKKVVSESQQSLQAQKHTNSPPTIPSNSQLKTQNCDYVFTLHLPGLKKTTQFHWSKKNRSNKNSMIVDYEFFNFICNSFGITSRRAKIYRLNTNGVADNIFSPFGHGDRIFNGDTLILVVRKTKDESMNEYYNNQIESLMNNMYLEPQISKNNAAYLLTEINMNFPIMGIENYFPGGCFYETEKIYYNRLQNYA